MVLNEQQKELAEKNHNIIYWIAKKHGLDIEEYYGDLAIALCKAAYHYDESTGYTFTTYAQKCLENRIKDLARMKKQTIEGNEEVVSLDSICYTDDGLPIALEDTVVSNTESFESAIINKISLKNFAKSLDNREKHILKELLLGKTQQQIAEGLQLSNQRVNQIIKKIRKKYKGREGN